jgi:hypothetical protein
MIQAFHPGELAAKHYFARESQAFWQWSESFDTVVSPQGTTIAFYEEVTAVLRALQPHGFPPFDSIAVFLAACRDHWRGDEGLMRDLMRHMIDAPEIIARQGLWSALSHFHSISSGANTSVEGKATLATMVFELSETVLAPDEAAKVVSALEQRILTAVGHREPSPQRLASAYDGLIAGLNHLTPESIALRMQTGLDALPSEAPIPDLPPAERARLLVRELQDEDDELQGVAKVALDLMAAVHIPRSVDEPEELPLGGYSDITNRGAPDRLLLSELAQDDDVLATRVNLNEALYLRREAPPRTPQRERVIVIDTGIRIWGVPRVLATALGLALCATADPRHGLQVLRAAEDENGAEFADLATRCGLIEQLGALTTEPHPGDLLTSAVAHNELSSPHDLILITHPDAFHDREFETVLRELNLAQLYVALVDAGGNYELWRVSPQGQKRLQRASCSLDSILIPGSRTSASLLNPAIDPDLPLALRMRQFPLLVAHPLHSEIGSYHPSAGLVVYVRDGRVIHWEKPRLGGKMLYFPTRRGAVEWIWLDEQRREVLLVHAGTEDQPAFLVNISLDGGNPREVPLEIEVRETQFCVLPGDYLVAIVGGTRAYLLCRRTGRRLSSHPLDGRFVLEGRYLSADNNDFSVLSVAGGKLFFEAVVSDELPKSTMCRCFDREGVEGTHIVMTNGSIFRLKPKPSLVHKMPAGAKGVRSISRDGSRVLYVDDHDVSRLVDLNTGRFDIIPPRARHPLQFVEKNISRLLRRMPTMRKNFRSAAITQQGHICLVTRNNQWLQLRHVAHQSIVILQQFQSMTMAGMVVAFTRVDSPYNDRHCLERADFDDGTKFYLDSRGFLHIVPGDNTLPQAAIVIKDGMLSGWFSDGVWFGDRYFIGDRTPIDSATVFDRLKQYASNLQCSISS